MLWDYLVSAPIAVCRKIRFSEKRALLFDLRKERCERGAGGLQVMRSRRSEKWATTYWAKTKVQQECVRKATHRRMNLWWINVKLQVITTTCSFYGEIEYDDPLLCNDKLGRVVRVELSQGSSCIVGRVVTRVELSRGSSFLRSSCLVGRVVTGRVVLWVELSQGSCWLNPIPTIVFNAVRPTTLQNSIWACHSYSIVVGPTALQNTTIVGIDAKVGARHYTKLKLSLFTITSDWRPEQR